MTADRQILAASANSLYVATTGSDTNNDCLASAQPCATIEWAVHQATDGDHIKIASGVYTDSNISSDGRFLVISKTLTLEGGYSSNAWGVPDFVHNPTLLDAQNLGTVVVAETPGISVTIAGITLQHGLGYGVSISDAQLVIRDSAIVSASGIGLFLINSDASQILSTTVSANSDHGVYIDKGNDSVLLHHANIHSNGGWGLYTNQDNDDLSVIVSTIANNGRGGAYFDNGNDRVFFLGTIVEANVGGGISVKSGLPGNYFEIRDSRIQNNTRGGVFLGGGSDNTLSGNVIAGNGIPNAAAGLYVFNANNLTVDNNIFANNSGLGIDWQEGYGYLRHNTISDNRNPYNAIRVQTATITITNNIVRGTSAAIRVQHPVAAVYASHTLWGNGPIGDPSSAGSLVTSYDFFGDPGFVGGTDPFTKYHIGASSIAIDKGTHSGLALDIDGEGRPRGGSPDLGADEYPGTVNPVSGVAVEGPTTGFQFTEYTYTATVQPLTVTLPVTFVWQATNQQTLTQTVNSWSSSVSFSWTTSGSHLITVTASNGASEQISITTTDILGEQALAFVDEPFGDSGFASEWTHTNYAWRIDGGALHNDGLDDGAGRFVTQHTYDDILHGPDYLEMSFLGMLKSTGAPQEGRGILLGLVADVGGAEHSLALRLENGDTGGPPTNPAISLNIEPGAPSQVVVAPQSPVLDRFYHVKTVRQNGVWSLYVDGVLAGTYPDPYRDTVFERILIVTTGSVVVDDIVVNGRWTSESVFIPPDSFQRGCDGSRDTCNPDETPLHEVSLEAYYIDRYEVTNARYQQCVAAGACTPPDETGSYSRPAYYGAPEFDAHPVIQVSWSQANDFCAWDGRRLPTEAEWEMAARGSEDTRVYPWGDQAPDCTRANFAQNTGDGGCEGDTVRVGSYPDGASPFGVADLTGNVWEWLSDWYGSDYYCAGPAADVDEPWTYCTAGALPYATPWANPSGPSSGTLRSWKGGSWNYNVGFARIARRASYDPLNAGGWNGGFRCVRSAHTKLPVEEPQRTLQITVNNDQGTAVGNASVVLDSQATPVTLQDTTGADGVATFGSLEFGSYDVHVSATHHEQYDGTITVVGGAGAQSETLTLTAQPFMQIVPDTVVIGAVQGETSGRQVSVENSGAAPLSGVSIDLPPNIPWMHSAEPAPFPAVDPGQSVDIMLFASPPETQALGTYQDYLTVSADGGLQRQAVVAVQVTDIQTRNLRIELSDGTDTLIDSGFVVLTQQELSVHTFGSREVQYNEQFIGEIDGSGAPFDGLAPGMYNYQVMADGYELEMGAVLISAGAGVQVEQVTVVPAPFDYVWNVTVVDDEFEITLELTYDTGTSEKPPVLSIPPRCWPHGTPGEPINDTISFYNPSLISVTITDVEFSGVSVVPQEGAIPSIVPPRTQVAIPVTSTQGASPIDTFVQASFTYTAVKDEIVTYSLNPSSETSPVFYPGEIYTRTYVVEPVVFSPLEQYTLTVSENGTLPWVSVAGGAGPMAWTADTDIPVSMVVTAPVYLLDGVYTETAKIEVVGSDGANREGTLVVETTKSGAGLQVHTAFQLGPIPYITKYGSSRGQLYSRPGGCSQGSSGGWTPSYPSGSSGSTGKVIMRYRGPVIPKPPFPFPLPRYRTYDHQQVRVQLSQRMMLEGEAFRASLALKNTSTGSLEDVEVDIRMVHPSGVDLAGGFTVIPEAPTSLGVIVPGSSSNPEWLLVPEDLGYIPPSGMDVEVTAMISYTWNGVAYSVETDPELITVYPSPELVITYELPPPGCISSVFDLKTLIENQGEGPARNLRFSSSQPVITENGSDLLIDFKITESYVDSVPQDGSLDLNLGTLAPGADVEVAWRLEASLPGQFVEFTADYRQTNHQGLLLSPRIREINTVFANDKCVGGITPTYTASGRVTENSAGLAGVKIYLDAQGSNIDEAITNSDGDYSFIIIEPGDYVLRPELSGYSFNPITRVLTVGPDKGELDFEALADPTTYSIEGVVAEEGVSLRDVTVYISTGGVQFDSFFTGMDGHFSFNDLDPGEYIIRLEKSGYTFSPPSETVTIGPDRTDLYFEASKTMGFSTISGRVLDESGEGVSGVTLSYGGEASVTTLSAGIYDILGLDPGTYTVTPSKVGYTFDPPSILVTVPPDRSGINFLAMMSQTTFNIEGSVAADGVAYAGFDVHIEKDGVRFDTATTGTNGHYSFSSLDAGTYILTPERTGFTFTPTSRTVTVGPDQQNVNFEAIKTSAGYEIKGSVAENGVAHSGFTIKLLSGNQTIRTSVTDSRGQYSFSSVPPGVYTVAPERSGYLFAPTLRKLLVPDNRQPLNFSAYPISENVAVAKSTVSILPRKIKADGVESARIEVVLRNNNNQPIEGKSVEVISERGPLDTFEYEVGLSDSNGRATILVSSRTPGKAKLWAFVSVGGIRLEPSVSVEFEHASLVSTELLEAAEFSAERANESLDRIERDIPRIVDDSKYFHGAITEQKIKLYANRILFVVDSLGFTINELNGVKAARLSFPGYGYWLNHLASQAAIASPFACKMINAVAIGDGLEDIVDNETDRRAYQAGIRGGLALILAQYGNGCAAELAFDAFADGSVVWNAMFGEHDQDGYGSRTAITNARGLINENLEKLQGARVREYSSVEEEAFQSDITARTKMLPVFVDRVGDTRLTLDAVRAANTADPFGGDTLQFVTRAIAKGLADYYFGPAGKFLVQGTLHAFDTYMIKNALEESERMTALSDSALMQILPDVIGQLANNLAIGIHQIIYGHVPETPQGDILSVEHITEGKVFEKTDLTFWDVDAAYSLVTIKNTGPSEAQLYLVTRYLAQTTRLGVPWATLWMNETSQPVTLAPNEERTVRVEYKGSDIDYPPREKMKLGYTTVPASPIIIDLVSDGGFGEGLFFCDHDWSEWDPEHNRIWAAGDAGGEIDAEHVVVVAEEVVPIDSPVLTSITGPSTQGIFTGRIWVNNPYEEAVSVIVNQTIPVDLKLEGSGLANLVGDALEWTAFVSPYSSEMFTFTFTLDTNPGTQVQLPGAKMSMLSPDNATLVDASESTTVANLWPFYVEKEIQSWIAPGGVAKPTFRVNKLFSDIPAEDYQLQVSITNSTGDQVWQNAKAIEVSGDDTQTISFTSPPLSKIGEYQLHGALLHLGTSQPLFLTPFYVGANPPEVAIGIAPIAPDNTITPGEEVTYDATVTNIADIQLSDVSVEYHFPAEFKVVENSVSDQGVRSGGSVVWSIAKMTPDETRTVKFRAVVPNDFDASGSGRFALSHAIVTTRESPPVRSNGVSVLVVAPLDNMLFLPVLSTDSIVSSSAQNETIFLPSTFR